MSNPKVYLAGPIAGLDYKGATEWRQAVKARLAAVGIDAFSPMRGKEFLESIGKPFTSHGYDTHPLSTQRGIMTRDRFDATHCDVLFVNFLGAEKVSIGTVGEIFWADSCRTPIVVAMEATGNPHEHAMINEAIGYRVPTLEEAVDIVIAILTT